MAEVTTYRTHDFRVTSKGATRTTFSLRARPGEATLYAMGEGIYNQAAIDLSYDDLRDLAHMLLTAYHEVSNG